MNLIMNDSKYNILIYLGFIPLFAAAYTSYISFSEGKAAEILWLCNVCNFTLALGLFAKNSMLIRISTLWLIIGTPLWILDNFQRGIYFTAHAFVIHVVGALVGIFALKYITHSPNIWIKAAVFGLFLTLLSRFVAPPELNINMSANVYAPLKIFFSHYYYYMFFNLVVFSITLVFLEKLLKLRFENRRFLN